MRFLILALLSLLLLACDNDSSPGATPTPVATTQPAPEGTVVPGTGSTNPVTTQPRGPMGPPLPLPILRDVRVGAHPEDGGWDRIVFEFVRALPGASIEYVGAVVQCGSGNPVPVAGTPLFVRFNGANAHDDDGRVTVPSLDIAGPGNSILRARLTCDFEAEVSWALAIDGRQPFKVVQLDGPPRLVIDVKH